MISFVLLFREAVRAQKAEEGRQRRVQRARLLSQQQAAMTAQQSRLEAERATHIRSDDHHREHGGLIQRTPMV